MDLPQIGWKAILTLSLFVLSILVAWLWGRRKEKKRPETEVRHLKKQIKKALAKGNVDAVARLTAELRERLRLQSSVSGRGQQGESPKDK